MRKQVVIVQPYVAAYRLPFFVELRKYLDNYDIDCVVAAGIPQNIQAQRGDAVTDTWMMPVNYKSIELANRSANIAIRPSPWRRADAVIVGLEGTSLPNYQAMFDAARRGTKFGVWGHIKSYVNPGHSLDLWLEKQQMRSADHVFAYTPGGAQYAANCGIDQQKITTVMNTVDTSNLSEQLTRITNSQVDTFAKELNLDRQRCVCFIGGLDSSKRIQFLAESLEVLWRVDPSIKVLVGGQGPEEYLLEDAYKRQQAVALGYVGVEKKALILRTSQAVCMPGRIGLVAVDALVARRPIITTSWPFHAPEVEYLIEGESRITSGDAPNHYAEAILKVVDAPPPEGIFDYPTIEEMTENFATGILKMMSIPH